MTWSGSFNNKEELKPFTMEVPQLQGSGEVMVPGAPDRKGGLDNRASQPALPTPISRTSLPFTPGGYGLSSANATTGYSPFRAKEDEHYDKHLLVTIGTVRRTSDVYDY